MPEAEFARIAGMGARHQLAKGNFLLREGDTANTVFFLLKGFMRMYFINPAGDEINYRFAEAPDFFVDFKSFLTQTPSWYYWQAMQDADVLEFDYQQVQSLYQQSPAWNQFGRLMAERVYLMQNERVELLQFLPPEQRYLTILQTYPNWLTHVSQAHLASYLGIKPESLSRIRHRLKKKNGT